MTTLEALLIDPDMFGVWNVVPHRSAVTFKIKNMWGLVTVKGRFTEFSGDGQLSGKGAASGRLDIQTASLSTGIGRRDRHLRSADFFDAERFGQISVVVTAVQPSEGPTKGKAADVRADLTIKGITAPLPLPVTVTELDDGAIRISGEAKVDRSQFDLGWNRFGMIGETATGAAQLVFARATG
ncbi:YceI family protein [Mycobacterium sp.]|uniref:YceI family protein n=1 Tax=Mycobacterium sp. TaxID=1785 RepID=UPI0026015C60|nr:YceI family protein [Mycobacterium sp.]MBW0013743.1 YceI family protein [Mycobacterium sp.]